jgi:hypothetical protein
VRFPTLLVSFEEEVFIILIKMSRSVANVRNGNAILVWNMEGSWPIRLSRKPAIAQKKFSIAPGA